MAVADVSGQFSPIWSDVIRCGSMWSDAVISHTDENYRIEHDPALVHFRTSVTLRRVRVRVRVTEVRKWTTPHDP